jgi:hypothetical protein
MSQTEREKVFEIAAMLREIRSNDPEDWQFDVHLLNEIFIKSGVKSPEIEKVLIAFSEILEE